jgi:hypothetical protein
MNLNKWFKIIAFSLLVIIMEANNISSILRFNIDLAEYSSSLEPMGKGKFYVHFSVAANKVADAIGVTEIIVQQKVDSTWIDIDGFSSEMSSCLLAYKVDSHKESLMVYRLLGAEYRAIVKFVAIAGNKSVTKTLTTSSIIA